MFSCTLFSFYFCIVFGVVKIVGRISYEDENESVDGYANVEDEQ